MDMSRYILHILSGFICGREKTCGSKVDHKTEECAINAAHSLSRKYHGEKEFEAYPCCFCHGWHIGGVMSEDLMEDIVAGAEDRLQHE